MAWTLSRGRLHVTDATNAALTGLRRRDPDGWSDPALATLRIPAAALPEVVDSSGPVGDTAALPGAPPIAGILGDQQASLLGQACVQPGQAKITFGTGAMLDVVVGADRPRFDRGPAGTFTIVTRRLAGRDTWGLEAIVLAAGTNVEWLRDDLGLIPDAAASHDVAAQADDTGDVWFVPALFGLGTPVWDYGARGTLLGLTRGHDRGPDRAGGAHRRRAARRRPRRRRDPRRRHADRDAAHRRGDERQPHVRAGPRRRHGTSG